jgi:hypothetical protein
MSTAIAEPPVNTPPAKVEVPPQVLGILRPTITKDGKIQPKRSDPTPEQKASPVEVETVQPLEAKPAEVKPTDLKPNDQERNWAEMRTSREVAEKKAKELEERLKARDTEFEAFKAKPIPKEFEERLSASEKKAQEYQAELRRSNLARDPEFQAKYSKPITAGMERMIANLTEAGIDPKEAHKAVAAWNVNQFSEWAASIPPANAWEFQAAYTRVRELDDQRQQELQDSEKAWTNLQSQRQQEAQRQQETYFESLRNDKKTILDELSKDEYFKANTDLRDETSSFLDRAAGLNGEKLGSRELMAELAKSRVLSRQHAETVQKLTELQEKLAATEKTLSERDDFIKRVNGSLPSPGPTVGNGQKADEQNLVAKLIRPTIRNA